MYPLTLLHYPAVIIKSERPEEECNWLATKTGHGPNCMYQYKIIIKKYIYIFTMSSHIVTALVWAVSHSSVLRHWLSHAPYNCSNRL